tara:strand:- start:1811 stop:2032 length:222 start_codon:yes stop_codon:yes gene_type:complete
MHSKPKIGDLVYIIDPNNKEPIKMGIGLVVGETESYYLNNIALGPTTPVLWEGQVEYLDEPYWMLEVISKAPS